MVCSACCVWPVVSVVVGVVVDLVVPIVLCRTVSHLTVGRRRVVGPFLCSTFQKLCVLTRVPLPPSSFPLPPFPFLLPPPSSASLPLLSLPRRHVRRRHQQVVSCYCSDATVPAAAAAGGHVAVKVIKNQPAYYHQVGYTHSIHIHTRTHHTRAHTAHTSTRRRPKDADYTVFYARASSKHVFPPTPNNTTQTKQTTQTKPNQHQTTPTNNPRRAWRLASCRSSTAAATPATRTTSSACPTTSSSADTSV